MKVRIEIVKSFFGVWLDCKNPLSQKIDFSIILYLALDKIVQVTKIIPFSPRTVLDETEG